MFDKYNNICCNKRSPVLFAMPTVLQAERLQSQAEVRMLLEKISESSRDRAEMVSNKVHNQLMAIVEEKVVAGERQAQIMEREVSEVWIM